MSWAVGSNRGRCRNDWASLVAQMAKNLPAMQETRAQSLGWEDPLEKELAIHSSILARRIPWTEEPDGLESMGSQRVRHDPAKHFRKFRCIHRVAKSRTQLSDFTFTFYFHALEKEMATHSSILARRIPWTEEPCRLQAIGLQRV